MFWQDWRNVPNLYRNIYEDVFVSLREARKLSRKLTIPLSSVQRGDYFHFPFRDQITGKKLKVMLIDLTGDSSDDDNLVNNTKNNNKKSKSISSNSSPTKRPSSQSISRSGGKQVDVKKVKLASLFVPTSGTSTSSSKAKGKGKEKESFGSTTSGSTSTSSTSKVSTSSFLLPQKPSLSTASTSTSPCSNSNPSRPLEYDSRWGAGFDNSDPDAIFDTSQVNYWTPTLKRVFSKHYPNDGGLRLDQVIVSKDSEFLPFPHLT